MPVDDTKLNTMLKAAHEKLSSNTIERSKLKSFIEGCAAITKVPTQDDPTIMEIPNDRMLGAKYSSTRRNEIYDKLLADKITLGL